MRSDRERKEQSRWATWQLSDKSIPCPSKPSNTVCSMGIQKLSGSMRYVGESMQAEGVHANCTQKNPRPESENSEPSCSKATVAATVSSRGPWQNVLMSFQCWWPSLTAAVCPLYWADCVGPFVSRTASVLCASVQWLWISECLVPSHPNTKYCNGLSRHQ